MNIEVRDIRTKYFIAAIQWSMICFRYSEEYLRIMSPITSGDCARDYFTHDEQSYIRGDWCITHVESLEIHGARTFANGFEWFTVDKDKDNDRPSKSIIDEVASGLTDVFKTKDVTSWFRLTWGTGL